MTVISLQRKSRLFSFWINSLKTLSKDPIDNAESTLKSMMWLWYCHVAVFSWSCVKCINCLRHVPTTCSCLGGWSTMEFIKYASPRNFLLRFHQFSQDLYLHLEQRGTEIEATKKLALLRMSLIQTTCLALGTIQTEWWYFNRESETISVHIFHLL